MRVGQSMPHSCGGMGFCLRVAQDKVSAEEPSIIMKWTYLQCNVLLLQSINPTMKEFNSSPISDVSGCSTLDTLPSSPLCNHKE